jgi:hypothetical protein
MIRVNFIFPAVKELVLLADGCACEIIVTGHGWVHGTKLTVIDPPPIV